MGVSLYLIFYNKLSGPKTWIRLMLLISTFLTYLLMGGYLFNLLNFPIDIANQNEIFDYVLKFYDKHKCIPKNEINDFIDMILNASNNGIVFAEDSRNITQSWVFGGESLFFTFTLLSTIGYGHIVTKYFSFDLF